MSRCQLGQPLTSMWRCQTVSSGASILIWMSENRSGAVYVVDVLIHPPVGTRRGV
jgi:hypothetical protein